MGISIYKRETLVILRSVTDLLYERYIMQHSFVKSSDAKQNVCITFKHST